MTLKNSRYQIYAQDTVEASPTSDNGRPHLAQLAEHQIFNLCVGGSSPSMRIYNSIATWGHWQGDDSYPSSEVVQVSARR